MTTPPQGLQPVGHYEEQTDTRTNQIWTVRSHNEWDPLEEVIVGRMDNACVPEWDVTLEATMPRQHRRFFEQTCGHQFPQERIEAANEDLDQLTDLLEAEGVTVRRPDPVDHTHPFSTPDWKSPGGLYSAMPRDALLVIGDELIEAPMAWRSRYFESHAYRSLLKEYFRQGSRWTSAPKPELRAELYVERFVDPKPGEPKRWAITEFEPTFDVADFLRCGRDILYIRSHVTNAMGVEWLKRHLGNDYHFHELPTTNIHPMHIDTTYMPLAAHRVMINPERVTEIHPYFKHWEVLEAPAPCTPPHYDLYMSGPWLSMNVLSIDGNRIVVAEHEERLIRALEDWGFTPLPVRFANFYRFGGSIHCATLDVRRRSELISYN